MEETVTSLLQNKVPAFLSAFGSEIEGATDFRGDTQIVVKPARLREMIRFLKEDSSSAFNVMMDLFGMDYLKLDPPTPERFAVIYNLYAMSRHKRIFLKVYLPEEKPEIDSIHDLYKAANWFEREAWDMFGIVFKGHPNLIRILCHNEFVGYPMRKDYPADKYQRLKNAALSSGI